MWDGGGRRRIEQRPICVEPLEPSVEMLQGTRLVHEFDLHLEQPVQGQCFIHADNADVVAKYGININTLTSGSLLLRGWLRFFGGGASRNTDGQQSGDEIINFHLSLACETSNE